MGTKLRALYQRSKGRDLFDLATAIDRVKALNRGKIVECFERYLKHEDSNVSRAEFEANLFDKMNNKAFHEDMQPLLVAGAFQAEAFDGAAFQTSEVEYEAAAAYRQVKKELIERLAGEPWKGTKK